MGKFTKGTVVLVSFPFSDLRGQKVRPALVLARAEFDNLILCQITSKPYFSKIAIKIETSYFEFGELPVESYARLDKIFTADESIIKGAAGKLSKKTQEKISKKVSDMFLK